MCSLCIENYLLFTFHCFIVKCVTFLQNVTCAENQVCEAHQAQCTEASCNLPPPVVQCVNRTCSNIMCRMHCEYGFQKDMYGCDICACVDPCEVNKFPSFTIEMLIAYDLNEMLHIIITRRILFLKYLWFL